MGGGGGNLTALYNCVKEGVTLFCLPAVRIQGNGPKMRQERFRLDNRKKLSLLGWSDGGTNCPVAFKGDLDMVLGVMA